MLQERLIKPVFNMKAWSRTNSKGHHFSNIVIPLMAEWISFLLRRQKRCYVAIF